MATGDGNDGDSMDSGAGIWISVLIFYRSRANWAKFGNFGAFRSFKI
jgi:hypothetical protein